MLTRRWLTYNYASVFCVSVIVILQTTYNCFSDGSLILDTKIMFLKFSTTDDASLAFWFVRSISVISSYTLVWPYMENKTILSDKAAEKIRFRELSTDKITEKNRKFPCQQRQKSHKLWFKIIQWYSEVSLQIWRNYKLNSSVRRADNVATTTRKFRMACKSLQE